VRSVKKLLDDKEIRSPGRRGIMARAVMHVRPSHLADPNLFNFMGLALSTQSSEKFMENPLQLDGED
jgi:tRNA 2-thiocytidine biosynthesis protein TtcA